MKFEGGRIRGQVPHDVLARPDQLAAWKQAQEDKAQAALRKSEAATTAVAAASDGDSAAPALSGVASRIPSSIMERSKAAKARKLG